MPLLPNLRKLLRNACVQKFYKDVASVRKSPTVRNGDLDTRALSESILVITRLLPGSPGVLGVVNLSDEAQDLDLSSLHLLPAQLRVVASGVDCSVGKGAPVSKSNVHVSGHCALLLQTVDNCC